MFLKEKRYIDDIKTSNCYHQYQSIDYRSKHVSTFDIIAYRLSCQKIWKQCRSTAFTTKLGSIGYYKLISSFTGIRCSFCSISVQKVKQFIDLNSFKIYNLRHLNSRSCYVIRLFFQLNEQIDVEQNHAHRMYTN